LQALWQGDASGVRTTACKSDCLLHSELGEQTYQDGRSELIEVLATLMNQFHTSVPGSQLVVNAQDSMGKGIYWGQYGFSAFWRETEDHVYAARFTVSAFHKFHNYPGNDLRALREYRDYDIGQEPANLGDSQILAKRRAFARYELAVGGTRDQDAPDYCSVDSVYCHWTQRKYAVITLSSANL